MQKKTKKIMCKKKQEGTQHLNEFLFKQREKNVFVSLYPLF